MSNIHPTAIIEEGAKIHPSVIIGAYAVVEKNAVIEENSQIMHHATVTRFTTVGAGTAIHPYCLIGGEPQISNYTEKKDLTSKLVIGKNCDIRENTTIHRGSLKDDGITQIGNNCFIMASVHIGHDSIIGDHTIIASLTGLSGHVKIGSHVIFSGLCGIAQFCEVGDYVFVTGKTSIRNNVPPYVIVDGGEIGLARGVNVNGLKRHGFSPDTIRDIRNCFNLFYRQETLREENIEEITRLYSNREHVKSFVEFVTTHSNLCHAKTK